MSYRLLNGTTPAENLMQLTQQEPRLASIFLFVIFFVTSMISFAIQDKRKGFASLSFSLASSGIVTSFIGAILNSIDVVSDSTLTLTAGISLIFVIWAFFDKGEG